MTWYAWLTIGLVVGTLCCWPLGYLAFLYVSKWVHDTFGWKWI